MSEPQDRDSMRRAALSAQDLAIAALVGRYIERREQAESPCVHDLFAVAAEFGDTASPRCARSSPAPRRCALPATTRAPANPPADDGAPSSRAITTHERSARVPEPVRPDRPGRLDGWSACPTVVEALWFEDLPLGSRRTRRAVVRWSNGSEGEALRWYADEILICRGRPDRQDSRAVALAAFPSRPRLAAGLTVAAR
jgi:hypothetical protein